VTGPTSSQRRLPFTAWPNPGISTIASSPNAATSSSQFMRYQSSVGTDIAASMPSNPITIAPTCRVR